MQRTIERINLQLLAVALFVTATAFLIGGVALALAKVVGVPLACVIVATALAVAGGGVVLAMPPAAERRSPQTSTEVLLARAVSAAVEGAIMRMLRQRP